MPSKRGMASKTWIHIVTFGYTSELVINRVSVMRSDFTFVASHFTFKCWISRWKYSKSGKSPSNSVNIHCTFASFKWLGWVGSKYWAPHWRRWVWSASRRWSMSNRYIFSFPNPVLTDYCLLYSEVISFIGCLFIDNVRFRKSYTHFKSHKLVDISV